LIMLLIWYCLRVSTAEVSYYSQPQNTASGEYFTYDKAVVASPTLPLGTKLLLHKDGRFKVVRVIDRGPYEIHSDGSIFPLIPHHSRQLDLSRSVFEYLFEDTTCGIGDIQMFNLGME